MKKILSILGTIALIPTSTASLVACNSTQEYTKEKLADLKEKNNIKTKDGILEWIAPQEKPFNQLDNKYYFVVWKNNNWNITNFKNNTLIDRWHPSIKLDSKNEDENYELNLERIRSITTLVIRSYSVISDWPAPRFKYVYRWNGDEQKLPNPVINESGNIKVNT